MTFLRDTYAEYTWAYQGQETTPLEVAEAALAAIADSQRGKQTLGAFVAVDEERTRQMAQASTERWQAGRPLGPLDGVPVAIKDEFDVAGYRTRVGTTFRGLRPATGDAVAVDRLRKVGAVLLGKTAMTEIGLGGTGLNPNQQTPRNPHDPTRLTGGSSSGSAAAVAAGICTIALGSDAGGSIRIPAALCGVYGLKPTYGRIPSTGGSLLAWSLDHVGPIGASISDLVAFYQATAGPHASDPSTSGSPAVGRFDDDEPPRLSELTFGWCPRFGDDAEDDVRRGFHQALDHLRAAGATVVEVDLEWVEWVQRCGYVTIVTEAAASQRDYLRDHRKDYNLDTRLLLACGERLSSSDYLHAQRVRSLIRRDFERALSRCDVLLSPTTACTAPPIPQKHVHSGVVDSRLNSAVSRYTFAGNLTGFPCLTIPCGVSPGGMPIGLQMMIRPWQDEALLRIGAAVDAVMPLIPKPRMYWEPPLA